jgi:4-aminobutyrate aminotransferase-like enzyme
MATTAPDSPLTAGMPKVVDGYDIEAERARYRLIPDVVVRGQRLNRGTATVEISGPMESPRAAAVRARHAEVIFPNTLAPDSPVVELGWPLSGSFVRCAAGVYLDLYLAVAQKILDPAHPRIREGVQPILDFGLLTQREINTDDFLVSAEGCDGVRTPQELAALAGSAAARSFPGTGAWKCFLSNSGTEAVEAGVKLAWQARHKRFLEKHGFPALERVAKDLGIGRMPEMDRDRSREEPLLADYPFFMVGCWGAFHGRTLGALQFTVSKKAQRAGYPMTRWVRRVPFNGSPADLASLLDPRPIGEILDSPGGVRAVVEAGRIPRDLFAGFLVEPFQGEGGYLPANPEWLRGIEKVVHDNGGLLCVDEVQSFGRTGTLFFAEQLGVKPDVVATAKGMVVGLTIARAELSPLLHGGWHSNTWGGGKIFDVQWAWAVLDTLTTYRDPVLAGLPYTENCRVKGKYLAEGLHRLMERHPSLVTGFDARGLLAGISVRRRADIVRVGWRRGAKLLGCGVSGEVSRLRVLFLADAIAREIDEALRVLDAVLSEVEATPAAGKP